MRVVVFTVQVPFIRGGAEVLAEGLRDAVRAAGHEAEIVTIPFKWYPAERILDHMLVCRLLDLSESSGTPVDLVVCLKFPAYLVSHSNKVLWLLHQHRTAYELWDHSLGDLIYSPNGSQVRDAIELADRRFIPESKKVFTISANVSKRLREFCGIDSVPLYHPPPHAEHFYCAAFGDYFFFPSRFSPIKRQALVLEALARTRLPVRVRFAGVADRASFVKENATLSRKLNVHRRVEWIGPVTEEEKRRQYAQCVGVVFPPLDEDYGYVTLEAMLASKPVITCSDSGGPLEFVRDAETGLVAEPTPEALANAMDELWADRKRAQALGEAGREGYAKMNITWSEVVQKLLS
jgi:glycosyltransferase involved in cell wall biosynthesis